MNTLFTAFVEIINCRAMLNVGCIYQVYKRCKRQTHGLRHSDHNLQHDHPYAGSIFRYPYIFEQTSNVVILGTIPVTLSNLIMLLFSFFSSSIFTSVFFSELACRSRYRYSPKLWLMRDVDFTESSLYVGLVLQIHDILVRTRIRIRGSVHLTNGSGSGSCYFRKWPSRWQTKNYFKKSFLFISFLKLHLDHFS